jgi:hypothetical protein
VPAPLTAGCSASAIALNSVNNCGDLVGFYVDSTGNTDGLLATP